MNFWIVFLVIAGVWRFFLKRHFNTVIVIMGLISLYFCWHIFYYTGGRFDTPDWWGHFPYIDFVRTHWSVPAPESGWEFYHPPLYYFIAALADDIGNWFPPPHNRGARYLAIVWMLLFEFYGLLLIKEAIAHPKIQTLCSALFLFWPVLLQLVGRIGNEPMLYSLWAMSLYYLFLWYRGLQRRHLIMTLVLCAIMFLVKTSALVPLGIVGAIVLYRMLTQHISWRYFANWYTIWAVEFIGICASFNFSRTIYYKMVSEPRLGLIIGNIYQDPMLKHLRTTDAPWKFLTFDFHALFTQPYFDIFKNDSGRQFFWNSYLKSSLFGNFYWGAYELAIALNVTLVLMVVFAVTYSFIVHPRKESCKAFFVIGILITLAAAVINRLQSRTIDVNDARFTFPVVLLFIVLLGILLEGLRDRRRLWEYRFGTRLVGAFALMGFYFMETYA